MPSGFEWAVKGHINHIYNTSIISKECSMPNISIATQLATIQKQKEILLKKEAALKAQSHGKILIDIVKMARDA
jgi:hypothetical protein